MKKILFISNIPTPYRNDFYNELGKFVDLTVVYEAEGAHDQGIRFNWNISEIKNYKAIFLKNGDIEENKVNTKIFRYLHMTWDYIFVTNYSYRTEMVALIYLKINRIPYILEVDGGSIKKESCVKKFIKKILISGAKTYFSPSQKTDKYLIYYGAKAERIVRNPFTSLHSNQILEKPLTNEEKNNIRNTLGIFEHNVIIGVGQLIYRKGWDLLISIANELDAGIYIIGDGDLKAKYEKLIKEKDLKNVHLVGFVSNELTTQYYQAADLFVLPTRYDVWGLVINESLANGIPVITTKECTAGVELIDNNKSGILIPADDSITLKMAINRMLKRDDLKRQMAKSAIEVIKPYTIEAMLEKHLDCIGIVAH